MSRPRPMIETRPCPTCCRSIPQPLEFCSADCSITYYRDIPEKCIPDPNCYASDQDARKVPISLQVLEKE